MSDGDIVELNDEPVFQFGEKVRSRKTIRNDGTYVGKEIGRCWCARVISATSVTSAPFLQQFYIYGVDFLDSGHRVGMKAKELVSVDRGFDEASQA